MTVALRGETVARKSQKTVTVTAQLYMLVPLPGALSVPPNPLKEREVVVALAENLGSQMPWESRRIKCIGKIVLALLLFDAVSQVGKLGAQRS